MTDKNKLQVSEVATETKKDIYEECNKPLCIDDFDSQFQYERTDILEEYVEAWKLHEKYGCYIISGPTGCGKTLFLRKLQQELKKSEYLIGNAIIDNIYDSIREKKSVTTLPVNPDSEVILIDMLEIIKGKASTIEEVISLINRALYTKNGTERLIIMSVEDETFAREFSKITGYKHISMHHVRPNRVIIRDCENKIGISIRGRVENIYNVANEESLIMNIEKNAMIRQMSSKRRVRVEDLI